MRNLFSMRDIRRLTLLEAQQLQRKMSPAQRLFCSAFANPAGALPFAVSGHEGAIRWNMSFTHLSTFTTLYV
jgi:hypothetical protein